MEERYQKYEQFTDGELIDRLRNGESEIEGYLYEKYKDLVRNKAKTMFLLGGDNDDLIQEGMIGLFKAVRSYDSGRDASFYTYADLCISRQMYSAIQASHRKKNEPLNSYVSLDGDSTGNSEEDSSTRLEDILPNGLVRSPEELLLDKEQLAIWGQRIEKELSAFERQVWELYWIGMNYMEIAKVLGRDEKATDNALQRVKAKIKKMIQAE